MPRMALHTPCRGETPSPNSFRDRWQAVAQWLPPCPCAPRPPVCRVPRSVALLPGGAREVIRPWLRFRFGR